MSSASIAMALFTFASFSSAQTPVSVSGRLFFTPEKRAALDRQRQLNLQVVQTLEGETLSLDGIVQRSDGKRTVWINRRAQSESEGPDGDLVIRTHPRQPGVAELISSDQGSTRLKVGETLNRSTGEYTNRLGGGTVEARPAR
jgi:hypothetical protein